MTTLQPTGSELSEQAMTKTWGVTGFFAAIGAGITRLGTAWTEAVALPKPSMPLGERSEIFMRALSENANAAMDWLYYATLLRSHEERRYCIARALELDPTNEIVLAEVRRLGYGR